MYNFTVGQSGGYDPYSYSASGNDQSKGKSGKGLGAFGLGKNKTFSMGFGVDQNQKQSQQKQPTKTDAWNKFNNSANGFYKGQSSASSAKENNSQPAKSAGGSKGKKDIIPKRFGLNFNPPTIILEYLVPQSGKLYHHKMKILKLKYNTKPSDALDYLKKKHYQFFMGDKISDEQIIDLIKKLQKRLEEAEIGADQKTSKVGSYPFKKDTTTQNKAKDSKVQFSQNKMEVECDEYMKEQEEEEEDSDKEDEKVDYQNFNLNKLTNEELKKHKDKMEKTFQRNSLKPG